LCSEYQGRGINAIRRCDPTNIPLPPIPLGPQRVSKGNGSLFNLVETVGA
jgi:hypothetical protein